MLTILFIMSIITVIRIINLLVHSNQFLLTLLSLELLTLFMVVLIINIFINSSIVLPSIIIIILTIGACEASLGLSIIVIISREFGNDIINIVSMYKC